MLNVLIVVVLAILLVTSPGLSATGNMSQSEEEKENMPTKSMASNSAGTLLKTFPDKTNDSYVELVYNVTTVSNNRTTGDNGTTKGVQDMTDSSLDYLNYTPKRELPMAMIIAGPVAAVSIMLFLCASYYWHTVQLDRQAKQLSITLFVTPDCKDTNGDLPVRPQKLVPSKSKHLRENSDFNLYSQRRKSTLSVPTSLVPPPLAMGKRGSSWSALADQEILNLSAPRRHSTFIL